MYIILHLCRYFVWIGEIQATLKHWEEKFFSQEGSYSDIHNYISVLDGKLPSLSEKVYARVPLLSVEHIRMIEEDFIKCFHALNDLLLYFVPGQQSVKWYSLPALLKDYHIDLPDSIQEAISDMVNVPGEEIVISEEELSRPFPDTGIITTKLHKKNEVY